MVSTIERFHCIQDSQLGPNGVLYREVPLYTGQPAGSQMVSSIERFHCNVTDRGRLGEGIKCGRNLPFDVNPVCICMNPIVTDVRPPYVHTYVSTSWLGIEKCVFDDVLKKLFQKVYVIICILTFVQNIVCIGAFTAPKQNALSLSYNL